ncbi:cysteine protease [Marasmius tenuissimus]|uniref:Cysteine protease n=1 Tax=Marasmius tenuissimus TaxID=585030 RepID=A0ABR3AHN4_9AGAR
MEVRATITSKSGQDEEILVLLSRHILDTRKTSDYMALKVQLEDDEVDILAENHHSSHAISTKVRLFPLDQATSE